MAALPEETTGLCYLIYASSATIRLSQDDLLELLKGVRPKNEARGLTGMLLYRNGTYLQFLEGRRIDIDKLLDRLRLDRRHKDIRILREGAIRDRLFPDWSMAYKNLTGLKSAHVPGYSERLQGLYMNQHCEDPAQLLIDMFQEVLMTA
jgi:hypothetical protein